MATSASEEAFKHLSDAEIREFREIFSLVDKDGGGTIDAEEVGCVILVAPFTPVAFAPAFHPN